MDMGLHGFVGKVQRVTTKLPPSGWASNVRRVAAGINTSVVDLDTGFIGPPLPPDEPPDEPPKQTAAIDPVLIVAGAGIVVVGVILVVRMRRKRKGRK